MTDPSMTSFLFEGEIAVRVIERNNQAWFVVADVCRALGLTNPAETCRSLDEDEKGISDTGIVGGHQEMLVVNESGLYAVILESRKPDALRFRKWITGEVLPSLHQKGAYFMPRGRSDDFGAAGKPYADWSLEERRTAISPHGYL